MFIFKCHIHEFEYTSIACSRRSNGNLNCTHKHNLNENDRQTHIQRENKRELVRICIDERNFPCLLFWFLGKFKQQKRLHAILICLTLYFPFPSGLFNECVHVWVSINTLRFLCKQCAYVCRTVRMTLRVLHVNFLIISCALDFVSK